MEKRICFEQKLCGSLEFEAKRTEKNETDDFDITIFILITVQSTEQWRYLWNISHIARIIHNKWQQKPANTVGGAPAVQVCTIVTSRMIFHSGNTMLFTENE